MALTRLTNMLLSWMFDWACQQNQINKVFTYCTCQARSMNHRELVEDFSNSNLTQVPFQCIFTSIQRHWWSPLGQTQSSMGSFWDDIMSPCGGWFVIIKASLIIFVMIVQFLMQGPSCCPFICHLKKWYTGHLYLVWERFWEQGAALDPRTDDSRGM